MVSTNMAVRLSLPSNTARRFPMLIFVLKTSLARSLPGNNHKTKGIRMNAFGHNPFKVKRFGPKGKDSYKHTYCVVAVANKECVRLGFSATDAAINGASSSDAKHAKDAAQKLCDALNEQFNRYMRGEFHG